MCEIGRVIRQVVSIKAKHGPRLRELPKVTVKLIVDAGAEDQEVFRKYGAPGLYHDIGPSISHKAWIVSLYLEYKTYSEIARTTLHSTTSIKRYIMDFSQLQAIV